MDYESTLRVHLAPYFGRTPLDRIERRARRGVHRRQAREGRAPKTCSTTSACCTRSSSTRQRRGWATAQPLQARRQARACADDHDIRFLDQDELEALLRAVPDDTARPVDRRCT